MKIEGTFLLHFLNALMVKAILNGVLVFPLRTLFAALMKIVAPLTAVRQVCEPILKYFCGQLYKPTNPNKFFPNNKSITQAEKNNACAANTNPHTTAGTKVSLRKLEASPEPFGFSAEIYKMTIEEYKLSIAMTDAKK